MNNEMQTILTVLGIVVNVGAITGLWVKLEHRLTKVETKLDDLPCKGGTRQAKNLSC